VKAFLFENSKSTVAIAWTRGSRASSSLLLYVKPQRKAYRLRLEYDSLDQNDPCPKFDLRVSIKPIDEVVSENFRCYARTLPPSSIKIEEDDFGLSKEYSFGSDFITKATDGEGDLEYDVIIHFNHADPNAEIYLDVETRSDFLTSQMSFSLLYEDNKKDLKLLGRSQQVGAGPVGGQYV
jgi:hypothetical protein